MVGFALGLLAAGAGASEVRGETIARTCTTCHSDAPGDSIPPLPVEMTPSALESRLTELREKGDDNTVMHRLLQGLTTDEIDRLVQTLTEGT